MKPLSIPVKHLRSIYKPNITSSNNFWTMFDQLAVSFGNFTTNLILARFLSVEDFGVFALVYGVMLFIYGLHGSIVVYPLVVRGSTISKNELRIKLGDSILFTILLSPIAIISFSVFLLVIRKSNILLLVSLAMLSWLLQETLRRGLMAHFEFKRALLGDLVSYVGQSLLLLVVFIKFGHKLEFAFLAMIISSGIAMIIQAVQIRPKWFGLRSSIKWVPFNWEIGKWSALSNFISPLTLQIIPWSLAIFWGLSASANFNAISSVSRVINPVIFSLTNLIIPLASKAKKEGDVSYAIRAVKTPIFQGAFLVILFSSILLLFPKYILSIMFGSGSPYAMLETIFILYTFGYFLNFIAQAFSALLNGLERSSYVLNVQLLAFLFTLFLGVPLIYLMGVTGAVVTFLLMQLVRIVFFYKQTKSLAIANLKT